MKKRASSACGTYYCVGRGVGAGFIVPIGAGAHKSGGHDKARAHPAIALYGTGGFARGLPASDRLFPEEHPSGCLLLLIDDGAHVLSIQGLENVLRMV